MAMQGIGDSGRSPIFLKGGVPVLKVAIVMLLILALIAIGYSMPQDHTNGGSGAIVVDTLPVCAADCGDNP